MISSQKKLLTRLICVHERADRAQRRVDSSHELYVLRVGPIFYLILRVIKRGYCRLIFCEIYFIQRETITILHNGGFKRGTEILSA
jgi:hypothetical protein